MTLDWLLRVLATGALLVIAGLAAERVAGWLGLARRWTWAAVMAGSLLLPLVALVGPGVLPEIGFPAWDPGTPAAEALSPPAASSAPMTAGGADPLASAPLPRWAYLAWAVASLGMLASVAWSFRRLDAMCGGCAAARVEGVRVLVSERAGPMVVGVVRPRLLLPRWVLDVEPEERRLIVRHEREHVTGGDPSLLALTTLAVALMPWNPALWVQHRRLRLAVETDCDARVLAAGADRRLYGQVLLRTASHPASLLPVLAPALGGGSSHLERRIVAMTTRPPARPLLRAVPLSVLVLAVAVAACDAASDGVAPARQRAALRQEQGDNHAMKEFADGMGVDIARQESDPSMGYTGLTPYYRERRHTVRGGERVMQRVESHPVVVGVDAGSPAEQAGFREGDVLLAVNGRDSREPPTERLRPGMELAYRVRRDGRELGLRLVTVPEPSRPWPPTDADFEAVHRQGQLVERLRP